MKKMTVSMLFAVAAMAAAQAQTNDSYLNPPQYVVRNPSTNSQYSPNSRKMICAPSMTITPEGRLWATWFTGRTPAEDFNSYVVAATSADKGKTWEEVTVVDADAGGPVRNFDPQLWIAPDKTLWFFWAQTIVNSNSLFGVWAMKTTDVESRNPVWTAPKRLADGVMLCKPVVLSSGEWALPISLWRRDNSTRMAVSADNGRTWTIRGTCNVPVKIRQFEEPMLVERKDGSLWMLMRNMSGSIGESISMDRGNTFPECKPSSIRHTNSRFFIRRLASGNLLLVKHGPIKMDTGRTHLMAFISKDDGGSWSRGLLLDQRANAAYPDGAQDKDGTIYIISDFDRYGSQLVSIVSFTESDILSPDYDEAIVKVANSRRIVTIAKPSR